MADRRYNELDLFRFGSALAVLIYHNTASDLGASYGYVSFTSGVLLTTSIVLLWTLAKRA